MPCPTFARDEFTRAGAKASVWRFLLAGASALGLPSQANSKPRPLFTHGVTIQAIHDLLFGQGGGLVGD